MGYSSYAQNGACALPSPSPFHYFMAKIVPAMQLATHAKSSTLYGRPHGLKSKCFGHDGLLPFPIIVGYAALASSSAIISTDADFALHLIHSLPILSILLLPSPPTRLVPKSPWRNPSTASAEEFYYSFYYNGGLGNKLTRVPRLGFVDSKYYKEIALIH